MANLKFSVCVRFFLKAIAVFVGLAGLSIGGVMPIMGIINTVRQISSGELVSWGIFFSFVAFAAVFLIGAYLVFVSYLTLFKFSADAIGHLCVVLALILLGSLSHFTTRLLITDPFDTSFPLFGLLISLAPILLAVGFYRISKNIFIKLTGVQTEDDSE